MTYFISCLLGLALGSFANVCILRLPKDLSIRFPGSHCPHCKHFLSIAHNIPLLSFLMLRGKCYYCHSTISWQYPLIEGLMLVLFLFHAWMFQDSLLRMAVADLLGFYLLTISIIDYRHRIIPDELSLSLLVIGLLGSSVNPYLSGMAWMKFLESLIAGLGGGLLMLGMAWAGEKAFKKEALGGGDVKLIAATGAMLGWQGIAGPLLFGSIAGGVVAIILLVMKKKKLGETLPFGPFLSLGAYFVCLFPRFWPWLLSPGMATLNFP